MLYIYIKKINPLNTFDTVFVTSNKFPTYR